MPKILCVEDNPTQQEIYVRLLKESGFEVAVANDGAEAVEKARSWRPDLILMDLLMPGMDGFEAIEIIRSQDDTRSIPILSISAWASDQSKERALAVGANEHFTKPILFDQLLRTIAQYLKG
jgi:CheY-like chemotaxis protein